MYIDLTKYAGKIDDQIKSHFESSDTKRWEEFHKNLQSKKFQKQVVKHPEADEKLKLFVKNVGKHLSSKDPGITVQGATSNYVVKHHKDNTYSCSCPRWTYYCSVNNQNCKHINQIMEKTAAAKISPYQQESQSSCAAACLKAVLNYYNHKITELEAALEIGVKKNRGAETTDIVKAAKSLGFDAYEKSLTKDEVQLLVDNDIPIICDIQSFNKKNSGHYVVLVDLKDDRAFIMDPNTPGNQRELSWNDFESRWHDRAMEPPHRPMIRWGVIITPKLEKTAVLGTLALTGGLHAGANAIMKGLKGSHIGHKIEAAQMATGMRHAISKQKLNPVVNNIATYGIGPESLVSYQAGNALGNQMSGLGKGGQYKYLKKLRKNIAMTNEIKNAPVTKDIVPAVNRVLENKQSFMDKLPTVASDAKPTILQRAASVGLGGAAIAAEPHSAIHMGINAIRDRIGNSSLGTKFMKDQFVQGVQKGNASPLVSNATDLLISPAALDTQRLGAAITKETANPKAIRLLKSTVGTTAQLPKSQEQLVQNSPQLIDLSKQYINPQILGNVPKNLVPPGRDPYAMLGKVNPIAEQQIAALQANALKRQSTWKPGIEVRS